MSINTDNTAAANDPELSEIEAAEEGASEDDDGKLPLDVIFDILKNRRRRLILQYTEENEGPFTLSELAEFIAAEENDKPIQQLTSGERKRVYVGLYQCHLPRMDDVGILDFDNDRGTVVMNGSVSQLDPYLDDDDERQWPLYYGGLTVIGFALYGATLVPAVPISFPVVTLIVLLSVGGCSALQIATDGGS